MVGRDVIANLENEFAGKVCRGGFADGDRFDVGTAFYGDFFCFFCVCGNFNQIIVDNEVSRTLNGGCFAECCGVCENARDGGSGSRFGRNEINLRVCSTASRKEVTVEGTEADTCGFRREAHANARTASAFQNSCTCFDQIGKSAALCEHGVNLLGAGRDGKADVWMNGFSLEHSGNG